MSIDLDQEKFLDRTRNAQPQQQAQPRAVGSPLPMGGDRERISAAATQPVQSFRTQQRDMGRENGQDYRDVKRTVATSTSGNKGNRLPRGQRAMNLLRMAVPLAQRILPLLDGNVGTALSNLMAPQQQRQTHSPQAVDVNLDQLENGLAELNAQHREIKLQNRELREQMVEQSTSIKRVEHQLDMVREATDRNTLEQQELLEDFKNLGNKVNLVAIFALALLATSVILNVFLYLHIQRVLP